MTHHINTSPEAIAALLDGVTPGPWTGHNMIHDEGRPMTPEEIGEYVCNSVKIGEPDRFLFISAKHDDGRDADICHTGNGPRGAANTRFIAAARDLVPALAAEIARLTAERDEARALLAILYGEEGMGNVTPADATAALAARDAAMRNEGRRQVKVKPLEWEMAVTTYYDKESNRELPAAEFWQADTILMRGRYTIMRLVDARLSRRHESYRLDAGGAGGQTFPDLEAAKAAAQADYEATILAALEPEGGE